MNFLRTIILSSVIGLTSTATLAAESGDPAIDFTLPLLENKSAGEAVNLSDFRGQLVYIDFWASWCGPCKKALPELEELRATYGSLGFEVLAVNVDEELDDALGFLEDYPVSFPVVLDPKNVVIQQYEAPGMPTGYLVDAEGTVIYRHEGFRKGDGEEIEEKIKSVLMASK